MSLLSLSNKIKRHCSIFMIVVLFFTCINGLCVISVSAYEDTSEEEKLYYGYNVTSGKSLSEPDALQTIAPIIDPKSDYQNYIKRFPGTQQLSNSYVGSSISEITSEYAQNFSANIFGKIYEIDANLSSAFDLSKRSTNIYAEQYELYTTYIERYYYIVQLDVNEIRNYLSSQFINEISAVKTDEDAKNLFSKYGTHLITGFSYGGRLNITNYKTTSDTNQDFSQSVALSEKMSVAISSVKAGEGVSIAEQYASIENDATSTSSYNFASYGGVATSSLTLDGLFTYNQSITDGDKAGFMYTRWINSINDDQNLAIIGIPNSAQSIPLWDLLENSAENNEIRDCLLRTYMSLCGDKYDAYFEQYQPIIRNVSINENSDYALPRLNGAYIETPNGYFYYVEHEDLSVDGNHYGISSGEYIYLDLEIYSDRGDVNYTIQNGEEINDKSTIFKVTGTSGTFEIKVNCGDSSAKLLSIPIIQNSFEGGMGTEEYPYIISNSDQFQNITSDVGANYLLVEDIDFENAVISGINSFSGVLDGNYCSIRNFTIQSSRIWGLFTSNSGTIKNLIIENAGTATTETAFSAGGDDYAGNDYTQNSIHSLEAGIICGNNTGLIENCYLKNVYIRNIITNPDEYLINASIAIKTGALAGVNSGTVKNCMVTEAKILGSYLLDGSNNANNISIYSGGLIGELKEGTISSCVVDSGIKGNVFSQSINPYKAGADAINEVYATMFVGFCNCQAQIENSYVYVRNTAVANARKAVDVDLVFGSRFVLWDYKPDHYYALRGAVIVAGESCEITGSNISVYSADSGIKYYGITPTKNGNNNDGSTNTFKNAEAIEVEERKIGRESDINNMGLPNNIYICERNTTANIKHFLAGSRNDYMTISIDTTDTQIRTDYYVQGYFSPVGLKIVRSLGTQADTIKVFNVSVQGQPYEFPDDGFLSTEDNAYSIVVSLYKGEVSAAKVPIVVSEDSISSVYVDSGNYVSYYDNISQYYDDFSLEVVDLKAVLSGGEVVDVSENMTLFKDAVATIKTPESSIVPGENIVVIEFIFDQVVHETSFILDVEKRTIDELKIIQLPEKTEYNPGESVSLSGMKVELIYNVGESRVLETAEELNQLEITGGRISAGRNTVFVTYDAYSKRDSFEVTGIQNTSAEQVDTSVEVSKEENIVTDSTEDAEQADINSDKEEQQDNGNVIVVAVITIICLLVILVVIVAKRRKGTGTVEKKESE